MGPTYVSGGAPVPSYSPRASLGFAWVVGGSHTTKMKWVVLSLGKPQEEAGGVPSPSSTQVKSIGEEFNPPPTSGDSAI